jgi:hypothetical protein
MYGRASATMPGVQGVEEFAHFSTPTLADNYAVGAHAQRLAQQLAEADRTSTFYIRLPRDQPDEVLGRELQFRSVLQDKDALVPGDFGQERVEQGGLTGTSSPRDQEGDPAPHQANQYCPQVFRVGTRPGKFGEAGPVSLEDAETQMGPRRRQRWQDRVQSDLSIELAVHPWVALVQALPGQAYQFGGQFSQLRRI